MYNKLMKTRCMSSQQANSDSVIPYANADVEMHPYSGESRIFASAVRQLVPLECPKPLHALSPSDP